MRKGFLHCGGLGKTCGGHFKKGSKFCPRYFHPFSIAKKKALSHLGKKGQNLGHRTRCSAAGGREYPSHGCPVSMGRHRKRRGSKVIRQPLLLREGQEHWEEKMWTLWLQTSKKQMANSSSKLLEETHSEMKHKAKTQTRMTTPTVLFNTVVEVSGNAIRQGKKTWKQRRNSTTHIRQDDLHRKSPPSLQKKLLALVTNFSKITVHRVTPQKDIPWCYINKYLEI